MNNTQKAPYIKPKGKLAIDSWQEKAGTRQDGRRQILDNRQSGEVGRSYQLTVGKKKQAQDVAIAR